MKYIVAPVVLSVATAACSAAPGAPSDAQTVASSVQALATADAAVPSFSLEPGYYVAERGTSSGGPYIDGSEVWGTQVTVAWPTITLKAPEGTEFDGTYNCTYDVFYDCVNNAGGKTFLRVDSMGPTGRFDLYIDTDYGAEPPFLQFERIRD